jgi:hypothetical protein
LQVWPNSPGAEPRRKGEQITANGRRQILDAAIRVHPNARSYPNKINAFHTAGRITSFFCNYFSILF